ncbi:MAG: cell division protein FtsL [Gammaproteobacteria bacterium]|nr:cell division protein FtsL [Gammaproteobacteria bacterium]|tara:strand:- start:35 stop:301 length:267 start_codon:yes stop_codon:yes gene_type:complete
MKVVHVIAFGLLFLGVVVSGVQVSYYSQRVRDLHGQLQAVQMHQDAQLAEHSRLLLERSVETSYQNIERIAQADLAMVFPEHVEHLEP